MHRWPICVALCLLHANALSAQPAAPPPTPLLVDRWMSPGAGATVTNGVARLVAHGEDQFVPLRLFSDEGKLRRGTNAGYRLLKLALFDDPQENWLRVANHEVFGHGGRLRELFDGHISYKLPAPPPYGPGGGATFFEFSRTPTVEEILAVGVGGMEANYVMARAIAQDALTEGRWNYRDAIRYYYSEYDTIHYIRSVHPLEEEGHDVGDFLRIYNNVATRAGEKTISERQLRRSVLVSFANPLIAYSYYSTFISYVWQGRTTAPVPMIHVGATRYLPMVRFHLTSFGTEFVLDNAFVRAKCKPLLVAEIDSLAMLMDAVDNGLGCTLQPWAAVSRFADAPERFHLAQITDAPARRTNSLCSLSDDELSPAGLAARVVLADCATEAVRSGRWVGARLLSA